MRWWELPSVLGVLCIIKDHTIWESDSVTHYLFVVRVSVLEIKSHEHNVTFAHDFMDNNPAIG